MSESATVKKVAQAMIRLGEGLPPRELLAAIEVAAASLIKVAWAPEQWGEVLDAHAANVRRIVEIEG